MESNPDREPPVPDLSDDALLHYESVLSDLKELYVELAFLQSQELETKREIWTRDPETSIQARDRAASYGAAHITTQILAVEAQIKCLNLDRTYLERVLDGRA